MGSKLFYLVCRNICYLVFRTLFIYRVHNRENLPKSGGFIVASNHLSYIDPPAVGVIFSKRVIFMARDDLFTKGFFGWLLTNLSVIKLKRDSADIAAIKAAISRLKNNDAVVVFPEGTRSDTGELSQAHAGIAMLSAKADVPVVPVYVNGTQNVLPRHAKTIKLFKKIDIYIGQAIYPDKIKETGRPQERYAEFSAYLMSRIKELGEKYAS